MSISVCLVIIGGQMTHFVAKFEGVNITNTKKAKDTAMPKSVENLLHQLEGLRGKIQAAAVDAVDYSMALNSVVVS